MVAERKCDRRTLRHGPSLITATESGIGPGLARYFPQFLVVCPLKGYARGRHRLNIYGWSRAGRASRKCARAARDPWLLAAARQLDHLSPDTIVRLYAQRMRIEQSFRDTKNLRFGQGLHTTRSRTRERLQMLLLIGHLAAFVQRLIGEDAKAHQLELNFMATHRTTRPEISTLTLARRILQSVSPSDWLDHLTPWAAIPPLRALATNACAPANE